MTIDFNGSMLVKKIITDWKGPSRFRKWAKTKLYDRDRDWPVSTIGITGLRENFSRDRGIEETYWRPYFLMYVENLQIDNSLKWVLFNVVSGQITGNALSK